MSDKKNTLRGTVPNNYVPPAYELEDDWLTWALAAAGAVLLVIVLRLFLAFPQMSDIMLGLLGGLACFYLVREGWSKFVLNRELKRIVGSE